MPSVGRAYRWPFDDGNGSVGPHRITAAFGEFRDVQSGFPSGRLHAGQDMNPSDISAGTNSAGTTVYAIEGGAAVTGGSNINTDVLVGRFIYVHVNSLVADGTTISSGDPVATIKDISASEPSHLHLAEFEDDTSTTQVDPLRPGGLDNYTDNLPPSVFPPAFFQEPQGNNFAVAANGSIIVWGKVDIRAQAVDSSPNSGSQLGLYQMGFGIQNPDGTFALPITYRVRMSQLEMSNQPSILDYSNSRPNSNLGLIYDPVSTNNSFFYWLTGRLNSQDDANQDGIARSGFWNTKQKLNQDENTDAFINAEVKFSEGKYTVWSVGQDIQGNGGDLTNRIGADSQDVTVDNFMPYVQAVTAVQSGVTFYAASWPTTAQSTTILGDLNFPVFAPIPTPGASMVLTIGFSENMDQTASPAVTLLFNDQSEIGISTPGAWLDAQTWAVTTGTMSFPVSYKGSITLEISGAKDLAGNFINFNPQDIATRSTTVTGWIDSVTGAPLTPDPDQNHFFLVGPDVVPYVEAVTITQIGSPIYSAAWQPQNVTTRNHVTSTPTPASTSVPLNITLGFNLPMNQSVPPAVNLFFSNGAIQTACGSWLNAQTWQGTISTQQLQQGSNGTVLLAIGNAQDLDGDSLDANPKTIATISSGSVTNSEPGPDLTNSFILGGSVGTPNLILVVNEADLNLFNNYLGDGGLRNGAYIWGSVPLPANVDFNRSSFYETASFSKEPNWPMVEYANGASVSANGGLPPRYGQGATAAFMSNSISQTICNNSVTQQSVQGGRLLSVFLGGVALVGSIWARMPLEISRGRTRPQSILHSL